MKLSFEKSVHGRHTSIFPSCDVHLFSLSEKNLRKNKPHLPEMSENDICRHYSELAEHTFGINKGFYPLGSCTMKYNPKINEKVAALPGFSETHPLQPVNTVQGCLEVLKTAGEYLSEITGMDSFSFQPAAGAHGEFLGLLLIKAYFESIGDLKRKKILIPDSAHGTNPASAVMAGFEVVPVASNADGEIDLENLAGLLGDDIAGLMLTNPNTAGLFDRNILKITDMVHSCGGLNYYDGANMNAIVGAVRPGDMGFDVIHINLHKTFSAPHGGGGPGSGPVGCKAFLSDFLPCKVEKHDGILSVSDGKNCRGRVKSFCGNFSVVVKAITYMLMLGCDGLKQISRYSVLNANYLMNKISKFYPVAYKRRCMHEFVITMESIKSTLGISASDIAKTLIDYGIHPPTMYFPLTIHEALTIEPTETESKEALDYAADVFEKIYNDMANKADVLRTAPHKAYISRPDELDAARHPRLKFKWDNLQNPEAQK